MQKKIISLFLCLTLVLTAVASGFSLSAETTANSSEHFTVTNSLSGRNTNNAKYIDFAVKDYVERIPNALNTDGFSYKIGTLESMGHNYPYVNVSPNCDDPLYSDAVANAEAIITVLSADENNPSIYPMTYEVLNVSNNYDDIAIGDSTTTLYIIKPDGSFTTTKDFVTGDYQTEFGLCAGETAIFITTIPTNVADFDLTDKDMDTLVRFHSLRDACSQAYSGNNYYIDSIGLTDDVAAFEAAIPSLTDPIKIKAESYKGMLEASWSLSDIYAESDVTDYHVNLFDSEGDFVRSKTVTEDKVSFNVISGGSYKLQVSAFDRNGDFVVNSAIAQVTDESYFNITKGFTEAENMLNGPWNGDYTYNQFVTDRPVTPHNPDGKSLMLGKGTDGNDWVNMFFKTGIGTSATGADSAAVFVISVEDTAEIYNMKFAVNGKDTYNIDVLSIAKDGATEILENQIYFTPKANTINYIIIPLAKNNVTSVDEIKIWSDYSAVCDWKYYFDSLGFTNNTEGLINELTTDAESYFNITKGFTEAENMLNGPWNGEYTYNQFVTDRPITPHNPDGKSLMLGKGTDGNDWVNMFFKTGIGTSVTGADSAAVFVISVEDTAEIYNMRFAVNGKDTYNIDVVSIAKDGTTEILENQIYFTPKANTINYIIIPLAKNNVTSVDEIKIWSDCSAVCDWKYYFDSLGFTNNKTDLIEKLTADDDESYFYITKGFAEAENMLNGPWNGEYTYNQFATDRPITLHNPDGKSLILGKGTDGNDWVNMFFKTGIGTSTTGADSAAVFVISVEDTAEIYNMRFAINGKDTYNIDVVSIGIDGVTEVLENQTYFTPKTNTINYIIIPLAKNNVTSVDEIKIWSDCSAVCDWKYYFDSLGFTNNAAGLIASLKANEIVADAAFESEELVIPEGGTFTLKGFAVSGIEKAVSYFGSNPDIISVDEKTGIVTATGIGTAYASVAIDGTNKTADCKITVKAVELGDAQYNDVIDIRDLIRMKKYIAKLTDDIAIKGADFNNDKIVNSTDLTSMRKLLLNGIIREKSDLGFGYFGANLSPNSAYNDTKQMLQNGIANTFFASDSYSLAQLSKNGGGAWVDVYSIYADASNASTEDQDNIWKADFDNLVADLKATGYWDAVNGWFVDEPIDHQAIKKISEYATKYNKRFFVCYMAASVAPNISKINPVDNPYDSVGISEETTQYITDIAYDLYYNPSKNISIYEQINNEMHKNLGNNNPKIWHVTFAALDSSVLTATTDETAALCEEMIADLNTMYDFLKAEENKGGLLCYSYDKPAYKGQYGVWQINEMTNGAFDAFIARANEIGREICSSTLEN